MSDYDQCFEKVVGVEGGYVNDPSDPGGETKYGISKRQYPNEDIKSLTIDRAKEIYRADYWNVCKCDSLPWPLRLYVFDCAVNQGCDLKADFAAQKMLQQSLNLVQDGIVGNQTIAAANKSGAFEESKFMAIRALRYAETKNFSKYGQGWFIRLFTIVKGN